MMRAPRRARRAAFLLIPTALLLKAATPGGAAGQTPTPPSLTPKEAVEAALESHPAVSAASARVTAAEETGDAARAAWLPGAVISGSLTRFEEPMIVAPFHSLQVPPSFDRSLVQGRLGLQYTLFDGGARSARIRTADAMHEGAGFALEGTEMAIVEETLSAYVGALTAGAVLAASEAQVEALEEEHARASRELAAGATAELEVLRVAASLQEARADEATARARLGLAERALARLMGVDPSRVAAGGLRDVGVGVLLAEPEAEAEASPQVLEASRAVVAAQSRLQEERGGRLPTLEAGAAMLDYGTLSGGHVFEWQAGVQVSWPLFTGGARSSAVRRAAAEVVAAEGQLAAMRLGVAQAVDAARTAVVEAEARGEALELAVAQWEEVARIEALALDAGSGVQSDLLRAQAGLFEVRAGHAAARYDAVLAHARLARAQGRLDLTWVTEALVLPN